MTVQNLQDIITDEIVGIANPLQKYNLYPFYGRLRTSDINIDGFPDVILTLNLKGVQGVYR